MKFNTLPSQEIVSKTSEALTNNGMNVSLVQTGNEALNEALELIPEGAEVMTMSSVTADSIGLSEVINTSKKYISVKSLLSRMNRETEGREMQKLGAAPEWSVGSVHAVTEKGEIIVTSNTGSQLPAYLYGSSHVIWIISTQKIVKDVAEGMKRINEYILPQETIRLRKAYNLPDTVHSNPSKTVIINREITPNRIHIIFVNERLGF